MRCCCEIIQLYPVCSWTQSFLFRIFKLNVCVQLLFSCLHCVVACLFTVTHCTDMTSMKVAPVADAQQQDDQQQDEQSSEESDKLLTRNLLLSGVQNLAMSDESLTHQEEVQLVSATKVTLEETVDPAVEIGQDLRGMAEEVDGVLEDVKMIIDGFLDGDSKVSMQKLLEFFMRMAEEILKNGINKSVIMIVLMAAYALIRRYLKRYINEDILDFIERMASLLYQVFVKLGVLDWILKIGGWKMLKSLTSNILKGLQKSHWAVIGSVALLITGVSAYNFLYS